VILGGGVAVCLLLSAHRAVTRADPENEFGGDQLSKSHLFCPLSVGLIFFLPHTHFLILTPGTTAPYITVPKIPIISTTNLSMFGYDSGP